MYIFEIVQLLYHKVLLFEKNRLLKILHYRLLHLNTKSIYNKLKNDCKKITLSQ